MRWDENGGTSSRLFRKRDAPWTAAVASVHNWNRGKAMQGTNATMVQEGLAWLSSVRILPPALALRFPLTHYKNNMGGESVWAVLVGCVWSGSSYERAPGP